MSKTEKNAKTLNNNKYKRTPYKQKKLAFDLPKYIHLINLATTPNK